MTQFMHGKKGLIMGVANERSLAWGIAQTLHAHGAELAFSYAGDNMLKRVAPLAEQAGNAMVLPCDVAKDSDITQLFATLEEKWGTLDFIVHAIAFADKDELRGRFSATSRENFKNSLDISAYSFIAVANAAKDLMPNGGSLLTLSYYGAQKVVPNYNVMGVAKAALEASTRYLAADLGADNIRVNALSAGPVKTLAASGIGGFKAMLDHHAATSPLRRNTSQNDVGGTALYLLSDLASGVTGEVVHVDSGAHAIGVTLPQEDA